MMTVPQPLPRAPFETWRVQLHDRSLEAFIWYARPAVFVTQMLQPVATEAHAQLIAAAMDIVLRRFKYEIELHNGLMVIHDWRAVNVYDSAARVYYSKRLETYKKGDQRAALVCINQSPLVRAMLQLGAMALPFRTGHPVQLIYDPLPLLARHSIEPALESPFNELRLTG